MTATSSTPPGEPTTAEKMRGLPWALSGHTANAIHLNLALAGPVFMVFMETLDLEKDQMGLVLSIIPFFGVLSLVLARPAARGGFKRVFLSMWTLRTFILAAMIFLPWIGEDFRFGYVVLVVAAAAWRRPRRFLSCCINTVSHCSSR